jgi:starch synthase (maltosyl-transferring)
MSEVSSAPRAKREVKKRPEQQPAADVSAALRAPRVCIERVSPLVDGGRYPAKSTVGQHVAVEADVFMDGHDQLAVRLLWWTPGAAQAQALPMQFLGNDRWRASVTPSAPGRHRFCIEGWFDVWGTYRHDLHKKADANVATKLEITEGQLLLQRGLEVAQGASRDAVARLLEQLDDANETRAIELLLSDLAATAMHAVDEHKFLARSAELVVDVERKAAGFASWYELFPRSQTHDPNRHGTFDDVIARLPDIRQMGFDVLYFPPIHPIGEKNRKGRNNSLMPAPGDPGSPYAIGSPAGGHDAVHPQLGTLADFRRLVAAAHDNGLEVALDFAVQCSPDHPWLREHPEWFEWRPDGSIKYAENPPKKYQDIVNVDFYGRDPQGLWAALRDVVLFWVEQGVRIFRVDNPHTKPLPFWRWMIADVRARHPDVIFLAEAFTRPKMMYRLAKIGFSQSYTYFTWRNSKREFIDYLTELTNTEVKEFFRPHFFVNTPDINPYFLQTSGRPGFLIRAALAATLSGLWGVYSGFEQCESEPLPGREEYLNSEKYEIRSRDPNTAGNIIREIAALNRIRKAHSALQSHLGVTFYNAFNDQVLLYGKRAPGSADMILVAVNLDPHNVQEVTFELPLWEWKLPDHGSLYVEDLIRGDRSVRSGKLQRVRLDPADLPFAIWRVAPLESPT